MHFRAHPLPTPSLWPNNPTCSTDSHLLVKMYIATFNLASIQHISMEITIPQYAI